MEEDNTPGSEEECDAFFNHWLPFVAKEYYRLNENKISDQVSYKKYYLNSSLTQCKLFVEKATGCHRRELARSKSVEPEAHLRVLQALLQ